MISGNYRYRKFVKQEMKITWRKLIMSEDAKMILDRLEKMDAKITDIKLTLENETNRNIMIIIERQRDLNNKLDDVLKVKNEKEM